MRGWAGAWTVAAFGLAGCDEGGKAPIGTGVEAPAATVRLDEGALVAGSEYEKCYFLKLDNDEPLYIERIEARASGMHHLVVQTTDAAFADAAEPCFSAPERLMDGGETPRVLFSMATGATTSALSFPAGHAFRIAPHQQVMIDFHALNFRPESIPATVEIDLFGTSQGEGRVEIGYAILNNTDVELAPGAAGEVVMQCEFPFDVDFVSLASHMHMLGVASEVSFVGGARAGEVVHTSGDWNDGGMTLYDPPLHVAKGDTLEIRCDYDKNDSAEAIVFGPSAANEMCQIEGYVLGKDTVLGGTAPSIGIENCMLIRLDDSNKDIYREIIKVFSPGSGD